MMRHLRIVPAGCLLGAALLLPGAAGAQPKSDPDWPCIQRKAPELDLAQVWSGPDPASAGTWTDDQDAAALAQKLSSRRTRFEEMDALLDGFVKEAGAEANTRLLRVMAGVHDIIGSERARLIQGIERYARGQQRLADRVREEGDALSKAKSSPAAADTPETKTLQEQLTWDARIFDERSRSLTYVCETPVLMEQRAYEIGQKIAARMKAG